MVSTSSLGLQNGLKVLLDPAVERRITIFCRMTRIVAGEALLRNRIRTRHVQDAPTRAGLLRRQQNVLNLGARGEGASVEEDVFHPPTLGQVGGRLHYRAHAQLILFRAVVGQRIGKQRATHTILIENGRTQAICQGPGKRALARPRQAGKDYPGGRFFRQGAAYSSNIRPSRMCRMRSPIAAASGLCVIINTVCLNSWVELRSIFSTASESGGVEIAGRLIGKNNGGAGNERTGNRDALLLPTGKLRRTMIETAWDAQHIGEMIQQFFVLHTVATGDLAGDFDIAPRRQRGQQIELLKDEADLCFAQFGAPGVGQLGKIDAIDQDAS